MCVYVQYVCMYTYTVVSHCNEAQGGHYKLFTISGIHCSQLMFSHKNIHWVSCVCSLQAEIHCKSVLCREFPPAIPVHDIIS